MVPETRPVTLYPIDVGFKTGDDMPSMTGWARRPYRKYLQVLVALAAVALLTAAIAGCGGKAAEGENDPTEGRPESVTAFEAVEYTQAAADRWQAKNWMIQVHDGDPDGLGMDGKAKIWQVFYFSPTPEERAQMFVIYNRGNVWPNAPGMVKGAEKGFETYAKEKPPTFRVNSGEAYTVARRNGGGEYMDAHPEARANAALRCKADYDAVAEKLPAPKYKWIWDVTFREPRAGADELHVLIDGMNGDFITKEVKTTGQ